MRIDIQNGLSIQYHAWSAEPALYRALINESLLHGMQLAVLRQSRPEGIKADDPELVRLREQLQASFDKLHCAEDKLWEELQK